MTQFSPTSIHDSTIQTKHPISHESAGDPIHEHLFACILGSYIFPYSLQKSRDITLESASAYLLSNLKNNFLGNPSFLSRIEQCQAWCDMLDKDPTNDCKRKVCQEIVHAVKVLGEGDAVLIPGGHKPRQFSMFYELIKTKKKNKDSSQTLFQLRVGNTGQGLDQQHPMVVDDKKKRYLLVLKYKDIPEEKLFYGPNDTALLNLLLDPLCREEWIPQFIYEGILRPLTQYRTMEGLQQLKDGQNKTLWGCSPFLMDNPLPFHVSSSRWYIYKLYLRLCLTTDQYNHFFSEIKLNMVKAIYNQCNHQFSERDQFLIEIAINNLSGALLKAQTLDNYKYKYLRQIQHSITTQPTHHSLPSCERISEDQFVQVKAEMPELESYAFVTDEEVPYTPQTLFLQWKLPITGNTFLKETEDLAFITIFSCFHDERLRFVSCYLIEKLVEKLSLQENDWKNSSLEHLERLLQILNWYIKQGIKHLVDVDMKNKSDYAVAPRQAATVLLLYFVLWCNFRSLPADQFFITSSFKSNTHEKLKQDMNTWGASILLLEATQKSIHCILHEENDRTRLQKVLQIYRLESQKKDIFSSIVANRTFDGSDEEEYYKALLKALTLNKNELFPRCVYEREQIEQLAADPMLWKEIAPQFPRFRDIIFEMQIILQKSVVLARYYQRLNSFLPLKIVYVHLPAFAHQYPHYRPALFQQSGSNLRRRTKPLHWKEFFKNERDSLQPDRQGHPLKEDEKRFISMLSSMSTALDLQLVHMVSLFIGHPHYLQNPSFRFLFTTQFLRVDEDFNSLLKQEVLRNPTIISQVMKLTKSLSIISSVDRTNPDIETDLFGFWTLLQLYSNIIEISQENDEINNEFICLKNELKNEIVQWKSKLDEWVGIFNLKQSDHLSAMHVHLLNYYAVMWPEFFKEDAQCFEKLCPEIFTSYFITCMMPTITYRFLEEKTHFFVLNFLPVELKNLHVLVKSIAKSTGLSHMISSKMEIVQEENMIRCHDSNNQIVFDLCIGRIFHQGQSWNFKKKKLPCHAILYEHLFGKTRYLTCEGGDNNVFLHHSGGCFVFSGERDSQEHCHVIFYPGAEMNTGYQFVPSSAFNKSKNLPRKWMEDLICFSNGKKWVFIKDRKYDSFSDALRYEEGRWFDPQNQMTYTLVQASELSRITSKGIVRYKKDSTFEEGLIFLNLHDLIFEKSAEDRWVWQADKSFTLMTNRTQEPLLIDNTLILEDNKDRKVCIVPCSPITRDETGCMRSLLNSFIVRDKDQACWCLYNMSTTREGKIVLEPRDQLATLWLAYYQTCTGENHDALKSLQSLAFSDLLNSQSEQVLSWIYRPINCDRYWTPTSWAIALHAILLMIQKQELKDPSFNIVASDERSKLLYIKQTYFQYLRFIDKVPIESRVTKAQEIKLCSLLFLCDYQIQQRLQRLNGKDITLHPSLIKTQNTHDQIILKFVFDDSKTKLLKRIFGMFYSQDNICEDKFTVDNNPITYFKEQDFIPTYAMITKNTCSRQEGETWLWMKWVQICSNSKTPDSDYQLLTILFFVLAAYHKKSKLLPSLPTGKCDKEEQEKLVEKMKEALLPIEYHIPTLPDTDENIFTALSSFLQNINDPENNSCTSASNLLDRIDQTHLDVQSPSLISPLFKQVVKLAKPLFSCAFPHIHYQDTQTLQQKIGIEIFYTHEEASLEVLHLSPPVCSNENQNYASCIYQEFQEMQQAMEMGRKHLCHEQAIWASATTWIKDGYKNLDSMCNMIKKFVETRKQNIKTYESHALMLANELCEDDSNLCLLFSRLRGARTKLTMEQLEQAVLNESMWAMVNKINPQITKNIDALFMHFFNYEVACVELTQAEWALSLIISIQEEEDTQKCISYAKQLYEVCNQSLYHLGQCNFLSPIAMLVITRRLGMIPKGSQLDYVQRLCKSLSIKAMMGDGKSAICAPFWAFCQAKTQGRLPIIFIKDSLYSSFLDNFKTVQKAAFGGQEVFTINLSTSQLHDKEALDYTLRMLHEGIDQKRVLVMRPETLQMMHLRLANMLMFCAETQLTKEASLLHTILKTIYDHGDGLSDETHDILDSKQYVVIAVGCPEKVPMDEALLIKEVIGYLLNDSELDNLVGLAENRQGMLNADGWKRVREKLARQFFENHLFSFPPTLKQSFISFMKEAWGTPIPDDLRIYIDTLYSQDQKDEVEKISFFFMLLHESMPGALAQTPGLHFGRALYSSAVVPFSGANMPSKKKQIAYYVEALIKHLMTVAQQGVQFVHIRFLGDIYYCLAQQEMGLNHCSIEETQAFIDFENLTGINLLNVQNEASLQKEVARINKNRSQQLDIEIKNAISHVKIYPQTRSSSPQALPCLVSNFCGMSATPENWRDYNDRVGEFNVNQLVDGIITCTLLSREKTTQFYVLKELSVTSLLQNAMDSDRYFPAIILDLGALFKNKSNAENAQEYLSFASDYGKRAVAFFHNFDEEDIANDLAVGTIKHGQFIIERLNGSRLKDFQQRGLLPQECVFFCDHPHNTGTDWPIQENSRGLLTYNPQIDQSHLFQAIKRMRKFETTQYVDFACSEVCNDYLCNNEPMSVTLLLNLAITNQAIGKANSFFVSTKQKIREVIEESYRKVMRENPCVSLYVHSIYNAIVLQKTQTDFYSQVFGNLVQNVPMEELKQYADAYKHHFNQAFNEYKEHLEKKEQQLLKKEQQDIEENIDKVISQAQNHAGHLMCTTFSRMKRESGCAMEQEVQMELKAETEVEQSVDLQRELEQYQHVKGELCYHEPWWKTSSNIDQQRNEVRVFIQAAVGGCTHPSGLAPLAQTFKECHYYRADRAFHDIFSSNILSTKMLSQSDTPSLPVFHPSYRVADQILIIWAEKKYTFVLLSQLEADMLKTRLEGAWMPNVWLCNGSGHLFVQSMSPLDLNDVLVCMGLVQTNIFFGRGANIKMLGDLGHWCFLSWLLDDYNNNGSFKDREAYIKLQSVNQTQNNDFQHFTTFGLETSPFPESSDSIQKITSRCKIFQLKPEQIALSSADYIIPYMQSKYLCYLKHPIQIRNVPDDKLVYLHPDQYKHLTLKQAHSLSQKSLSEANMNALTLAMTGQYIPLRFASQIIPSLKSSTLKFLMPPQLLYIKGEQVPDLSVFQIKDMPSSLYPYLTPKQVECVFVDPCLQEIIHKLPKSVISRLDQDGAGYLKLLSFNQISWISFKLPLKKLQQFKNEKFRHIFQQCIREEDIKLLDQEGIALLADHQLKSLALHQVSLVDNMRVHCVSVEYVLFLTCLQLQFINKLQLEHLPLNKIKHVNPALYPHFTSEQACYLFNHIEPSSIPNLPQDIICLLEADEIILDRLKFLDPLQCPWLTFTLNQQQLQPFANEKYKAIFQRCISNETMQALKHEVPLLDNHKLHLLSSTQINCYVSSEQVVHLNDEQLCHIGKDRVPDVPPHRVNALSDFLLSSAVLSSEQLSYLSLEKSLHLREHNICQARCWGAVYMGREQFFFMSLIQKIIYISKWIFIVISGAFLLMGVVFIVDKIRLMIETHFFKKCVADTVIEL